MKRIAHVAIPILILASLVVLPVSLALGQIGGGTTAAVTVTAEPSIVYVPVITDVSGSVDVNGVFTAEVTIGSANGLLQLSIPVDTTGLTAGGDPLSEISNTAVGDPPPPPADSNVIGLVYNFGPEGATFDPPINLTFTYDESLIPAGVAEENLVIAMWDAASGQWIELVGCVINAGANTITGPVSSFAEFTTLAYTPSAPGGGGNGRRPSPTPLVTASGVFTQRVFLYSGDGVVELLFRENTLVLTGEGEPLGEIAGGEVEETYINEMGDVYIVKMDDPPPPPADAKIVGVVYDFQPDGATFDPPITITLTYDESIIPEGVDEGHLVPAWWNAASEQWIPLEVFIVAPELNIITAPISHFTPFTILAYLRPVEFATFTASNLLVMPTEVDVGEIVNINITITNTSNQSGSFVVHLKINGVVEASKEITVDAGDMELVSFGIVKDTAGTYSLEVAGFTSMFTVKEEPEPPAETPPPTVTPPPIVTPPTPPTPPVDWSIIGGIMAAITISGAGLLVALRGLRRYKYDAVAYPVEVERPVAPPTVAPPVAPPTEVPPAPEPVAYPPPAVGIGEVIGKIVGVVGGAVVGGAGLLVSILGAIGRVMLASARATAGGTRFLVSKAAVAIVAVVAGGAHLLVSILRAIGRVMLASARATATGAAAIGGGTRFLVSKAAVAVVAAAAGGAHLLVSVLGAIGWIMLASARATAGGAGVVVSQREVVGRASAASATAIGGGTRFLVSKAAVVVVAAAAGGAHLLVSILRAIGRVMSASARATATSATAIGGGTRFLVSKAAVAIVAVVAGGAHLLVSILRAIGRVMSASGRATATGAAAIAGGTRFLVSKAAVAVVAAAGGGAHLLVSILRAIGRIMVASARATAGGTRFLVSKAAVAIVVAAAGGAHLLVSILRAMGRVMSASGRATATGAAAIAGGTRFLVSKAVVAVVAAAAGGAHLLVSILRAMGRVMSASARATAGGTRFLVSKLAVAVVAAAAGGAHLLVSILGAIGRVMSASGRASAAGAGVVVSQREVVGRASATSATAIGGGTRFLVNKAAAVIARGAGLLSKWK